MAKSVPVKVKLSNQLVCSNSLTKSLEEAHTMAVVELLRKEVGFGKELLAVILSLQKQIPKENGSRAKTA